MMVRGVVAGQNPTVSVHVDGRKHLPIWSDSKGRRLAGLVGCEVELDGELKKIRGQKFFCVSNYHVVDELSGLAALEDLNKETVVDELDFHEAPARYHWY